MAVADEGTDGVIFLTMFASANVKVARELKAYLANAEPFPKPVIACLTAPPGIWEEEIKALDGKNGMVIVPTPERAAQAMGNLWKVNRLMHAEER